jgi:cytochrome c553
MNLSGMAACILVALTLVVFSQVPATAGDKVAGRQKAQVCQACHGLDGLGKVPGAPHLAGQDEVYFIKAMNDYRTGARKNEMMSVAVGQVTPADYADLAAFYGSLELRKD